MARTQPAKLLRFTLQNARWLLNPNEGSDRHVDDGQMIEVARELAEQVQELDKLLRSPKMPSTWRRAQSKAPEDGCSGGWLHMTDSMGRGPGIERCDECRIFPNDAEAAAAHARDCGCDIGV